MSGIFGQIAQGFNLLTIIFTAVASTDSESLASERLHTNTLRGQLSDGRGIRTGLGRNVYRCQDAIDPNCEHPFVSKYWLVGKYCMESELNGEVERYYPARILARCKLIIGRFRSDQ